MSAERKIKARYRTTGPRTEMVSYNKCWMDDETKSLQQELVTEEFQTYMVYFPQGHSIRVLGLDNLKALGYHLKPRMVDMATGDVIDVGGDPYDFTDASIILEDDEIEAMGKRKTRAA